MYVCMYIIICMYRSEWETKETLDDTHNIELVRGVILASRLAWLLKP